MPSIVINMPQTEVFAAVSDLTRHVDWASHDITIQPAEPGEVKVGSKYGCTHKGKPGDSLTVTELVPNERFAFHSVMPNKMEFVFTMTVTPQDGGSLVTRSGKAARLPGLTKLFLPLILLFGSSFEAKFLRNMKANLEQSGGRQGTQEQTTAEQPAGEAPAAEEPSTEEESAQ